MKTILLLICFLLKAAASNDSNIDTVYDEAKGVKFQISIRPSKDFVTNPEDFCNESKFVSIDLITELEKKSDKNKLLKSLKKQIMYSGNLTFAKEIGLAFAEALKNDAYKKSSDIDLFFITIKNKRITTFPACDEDCCSDRVFYTELGEEEMTSKKLRDIMTDLFVKFLLSKPLRLKRVASSDSFILFEIDDSSGLI